MNAHDLRVWLQAAVGKSVNFQGVQSANRQGIVPPKETPANGSCELYFPITVDRLPKNSGFGYELRVTNSTMPDRHGVYLPDFVNQCTRVNASANGIIFSGRFTGCTFVRCTTTGGDEYVGHIYVKASEDQNNPVAQARSFELECGAVVNSAVGFSTVGRINQSAAHGYVVGTLTGSTWQWNWMTVQADGSSVVTCVAIAPADWVLL